jgi:hypothetical protein
MASKAWSIIDEDELFEDGSVLRQNQFQAAL